MHRKTSIYFLFCFRELYFSIPLPMDSEQFRTEVEILDYILSCLQSLNVCFFLWEVSDTLDVHKYISHSYNEIILLVCFTCKCLRASRPWNEVMNLFINEQMKVMKLFWRFFLSLSSYEDEQYYSVADFTKEVLQAHMSDSWMFAGSYACCLESRD